MFETQKSWNNTSLEEIGLSIRTHASPKVGQDQVSGGVSVLCKRRNAGPKHLWFKKDYFKYRYSDIVLRAVCTQAKVNGLYEFQFRIRRDGD